jgi:hypothetical protein
VVVAELRPGCHVLADRAEVLTRALPDRLLKAVGALAGVAADAFAVAVVDGDEDVGASARVTVWLMSVPPMTSTAALVMLPSCALCAPLHVAEEFTPVPTQPGAAGIQVLAEPCDVR